jgi:hypothetical protein
MENDKKKQKKSIKLEDKKKDQQILIEDGTMAAFGLYNPCELNVNIQERE